MAAGKAVDGKLELCQTPPRPSRRTLDENAARRGQVFPETAIPRLIPKELSKMKNKILLLITVVCFSAGFAAAQMTPSGAAKDPFSAGLRTAYEGIRTNLLRAAEKMPEENYGMRPGPQAEVRTFGQIIGHLANSNFFYCSSAKGEKNPNSGNNAEKKETKAEFIKALQEAFVYCDGVYGSLTDAAAMEMVKSTTGAGQSTEFLRAVRLMTNVAHNNEHYGNIVTYLRIKSLVPPSTESRPRAGGS